MMMRSTLRTLSAALLTSSLSMGLARVAAAQDEEEEKEKEGSWTDNFSLGAYVDSYVALRSDNNGFRDANPPSGEVPGVGSPDDYYHSAYVSASGFGLASAGMDVAYTGEKFGATISLRVGPAVNRFYYGNTSDFGINNITQAYLTWKPFGGLTLDMGQFYTLYGAEVFESWRNMNYSRGALHYLMQPFWHTGLRANYTFNDVFALNAMIVNGTNTAFEINKSPTVGVQAVLSPAEVFFLSLGYMGALNPNNDIKQGGLPFSNFFDVVAALTLGDFKLLGNFDLNLFKPGGSHSADMENWWGVSVAPGYSFTNWFGAAARVEYLKSSDNASFGMYSDKAGTMGVAGATSMTTLTGTLDFKPVPNSGALVLRPEFRYELTSDYYFYNRENERSDKFWAVMLGAVVTSM